MHQPMTTVLRVLRALGEPTRLRLASLCLADEWSVGELAEAVDQSEPRVSRHLRVLAEAGVVMRTRRGQRVCYRAATDGAAAELSRAVLARLEAGDASPARDLAAARRATDPAGLPRRSRLGRSLATALRAWAAAEPPAHALLVEPARIELAEVLAASVPRLTVVAARSRARDLLRALGGERNGGSRIVASLAQADRASVGLVVVDHSDGPGAGALAATLASVRAGVPAARAFWIAARYDVLEGAGDKVVAHPIAALRAVLNAAGLTTDRLKPLEADGEHVLVAAGRAGHAVEGAA
jgi:DNA-binding transcriptional ArsR family regulator